MKSEIRLETELRNIKRISERFTVASVGFGEKNKDGQWENVYMSINFYGDHHLAENTLYEIKGNIGVKVKYGDYPAQLMLHCKTIAILQDQPNAQRTSQQTSQYKAQPAPVGSFPVVDDATGDALPF